MWRAVIRGAVLAAAAFTLTVALAAAASGPAAAHGGDVEVSLGTDGAGGVSASLTWAADRHPVEESAQVTVTAVADDGSTVGPVVLSSAAEGVGWYRSAEGILGAGHWTLRATVTGPAEAEASTQADVVPPLPAPDPATTDLAPGSATAAGTDPAGVGRAAQDDPAAAGSGGPLPAVPALVAGAVLLTALAAAVLLRTRRVREDHER
ncbi:hypothetical protein L1785_14975 [Antribacter sp. KLBMP9083]|uniref:CopC domain-containing protein n=1 Tax=Antribacter soli TaxID=2910976 RepID=A0AA41U8D1_9MICO|nr:hypothetical protein [Antribacter soli]MCF4122280.1 hypothetical protein [Antribacter soli]